MVIEYKTIHLFGKLLFEKVILIPPFKKKNPMPDEACFLYVIEGEYNSIAEIERLRVASGESVLMRCGTYLSQMLPSAAKKKYEAVAVHFHPDVLQRVYRDEIPAFLKMPPGSPPTPGMAKLPAELLINKYIESVLFYFNNPAVVNEEILILKLKEIILLLNQTSNAPAIRNVLASLFNPREYSFKEVIAAHQYHNLTLTELAQLTNMSLAAFKREFNSIYNSPPAAFFKNKRLSRAKDLLAVSGLRVADIAFDLGFQDASHFSKAFKRKYGVSPSTYKVSQTDNSLS